MGDGMQWEAERLLRCPAIHLNSRSTLDASGTRFGIFEPLGRNWAPPGQGYVLQFQQMGNTITVRLPEDLADWLDAASRKAGVPRGRIIRDQLQLARKQEKRPFLRLAGSVDRSRDLSTRKGFSRV